MSNSFELPPAETPGETGNVEQPEPEPEASEPEQAVIEPEVLKPRQIEDQEKYLEICSQLDQFTLTGDFEADYDNFAEISRHAFLLTNIERGSDRATELIELSQRNDSAMEEGVQPHHTYGARLVLNDVMTRENKIISQLLSEASQ